MLIDNFCIRIGLEYGHDQVWKFQSENTELRKERDNLKAQIFECQTDYQQIYGELQAPKQTITALTIPNLQLQQDHIISEQTKTNPLHKEKSKAQI